MFKCFTESELTYILKNNNYSIKKYDKNSIVYLQNEICKSMDIILEGALTIQKIDSEGNVISISDFTQGDIVGENLLFSVENKYPMTVSAKIDVKIMHMSKDLILRFCQTNECFLTYILQSLSNKAVILSNRIKTLTMKTLKQCIIDFLLFEYYSQNNKKIKLSMSKKELAEKFGVQRSSLSRELNKMRKDGLIDFDAKYIVITDLDSLNNLNIED